MSGHYWDRERYKWRRLAIMCRLGGQNVFHLLGRDPLVEPLTPIEHGLFCQNLIDITEEQMGKEPDDYVRPPEESDTEEKE